jgi:hypothetical protein
VVGTRLKRDAVALLGRQREIFKLGLAVLAGIDPYDHARAPSRRDLIVHAEACSVIPDDETSGILTEREFLVTAFGDLISRPPEMRAVAIVARNPAHGPTCDVAIDAVPPRINLERQ